MVKALTNEAELFPASTIRTIHRLTPPKTVLDRRLFEKSTMLGQVEIMEPCWRRFWSEPSLQ